MWDSRLYYFEGAVLSDVLTICAKDKVLLHLAVLTEWRLETNIIKWSNPIPVGNIFDIMDGPFCKSCDTVRSVIVSLILFNSKLAVSFKGHVESLRCLKTDSMTEHYRFSRLSIIKFENHKFFRFWDVHILDL